MKILVTGSAGHLGEALMRTLKSKGDQPVGIDIKASEHTDFVGSITDRDLVREAVSQADAVFHTATLHKPHVGTHTRQQFIDTNISGTLNLLEEASAKACEAFVYTSTTSVFGDAMRAPAGEPAVWVTEDLQPKPKNIYGVTKSAAEDLCSLFNRNTGLPCVVLRTSRFFPEVDDDPGKRGSFHDDNLKVNELLFRRADLADIVSAHIEALSRAESIGFDRFIITATTPFKRSDAKQLGIDAVSVLKCCVPAYHDEYIRRNWRMFPTIDRVYDNTKARKILRWEPANNFEDVISRLIEGREFRSEIAIQSGSKGYHETKFEDGPYPVDSF